VVWVQMRLLKKSPRRWWLYTGLAAIPFIVLVALVQPIWVDPLFNKFGPMKDKALEADILHLADRAPIRSIFLVALVHQIWVDPLFNKFGPMKDKALEADILHLADRAGIEG